jgi:PilZ domain
MKMETKSLEKRSCRRMKMVMGLRVPGQPQTADKLVHTLDISSTGAKIGAIREWIQPGSVLTLHRRHARAQCQVMWSRAVGPGEIHIGIEFTGNKSDFWGVDLEGQNAGVWLADSER